MASALSLNTSAIQREKSPRRRKPSSCAAGLDATAAVNSLRLDARP
jgi:hypothetical protein